MSELDLRPTPALRVRLPDRRVRWPLIVLAGEQGAGKSHSAVLAASSPRFGQGYWLAWGIGDADIGDEYALIPGADYLIIDHDGTWNSIIGQLQAVREQAQHDLAATGMPPVLVVDSMTSAWEQIKIWTYRRARQSKAGQAVLAKDPNANIDVGRNLWNDARTRYRELMTLLLTFPGVVIVTARAAEVSGTDDKGRPTSQKEWSIDCHGSLPWDATMIVRMDIGAKPRVVKLRSPNPRIAMDTQSRPKTLESLDAPHLVFDVMGATPETTAVRTVASMDRDEIPVPDDEAHTPPSTQPPATRAPQPSRTTPSPSPKAAPVQSDDGWWERQLERKQGNLKALRELWIQAEQDGRSEEYKNRVHAAGKAAEDAVATTVSEPGDADPVNDPPLCNGTGHNVFDDGVTRTGVNGQPTGFCPVCETWPDLDDNKHLKPHAAVLAAATP